MRYFSKCRLNVVLVLLLTFNCTFGKPTSFSWGEGLKATEVHRGTNSGTWLSSWDLSVLKGWGEKITLVRLQLVGDQFNPILDATGEWTFTDESWSSIDTFLSRARDNNIHVIIDVHRQFDYFPRAHSADDWGSQENREKLCSIWRSIARRYVDSRGVIAGFDILNEPCPPDTASGYEMWNQTASEVTQAIREIDNYHTIIVESAGYGSARCFEYLVPTGDRNTVYSFHIYDPHEFSEQGTRMQWPFGRDGVSGYEYPGVIPLGWDTKVDTTVDAAYISSKLEPVRQFQDKYNARIYVGEFGCIRWTPTAPGEVYNSTYFWFKDVLDLIEAESWDWTYHAYRLSENGAYAIEHGTDRAVNLRDPKSDLLKLFSKYWN
ncbi:cellulase family glycosylhydrolase [Coraliomargarita sp. SDUM461004]|uniref:Cellulase family glycosylhydrolase n=1 Tax=Thalassobacterium sedimentorum TaxID=3041258 RepID=A0ABU1AN00_9BACT|nr:cellulase family glycosylhydrolase [Coraliomargarita sp. SDUM461004]MDQ8196175.1 cellulase family glycosylhydrolase [Coraliomargarita sp. SDUM461004]